MFYAVKLGYARSILHVLPFENSQLILSYKLYTKILLNICNNIC